MKAHVTFRNMTLQAALISLRWFHRQLLQASSAGHCFPGGSKVWIFFAPISIKGYHCATVQINLQSSAGTAATSLVPRYLILLNLLD